MNMKTGCTPAAPACGPAPGQPSERSRRIGLLILSIMLILLFMFGLAPQMERLPHVRPMVRFIEDRGIDATALYYTEIEEFAEAEINMQNTMDYLPRAGPGNP